MALRLIQTCSGYYPSPFMNPVAKAFEQRFAFFRKEGYNAGECSTSWVPAFQAGCRRFEPRLPL